MGPIKAWAIVWTCLVGGVLTRTSKLSPVSKNVSTDVYLKIEGRPPMPQFGFFVF